ncbi:hypothetical protein TRVL_02419 [Trypanosoma vivax]|nr:hypothetical protein TRVL_02419 [Trypanosoma vivax]
MYSDTWLVTVIGGHEAVKKYETVSPREVKKNAFRGISATATSDYVPHSDGDPAARPETNHCRDPTQMRVATIVPAARGTAELLSKNPPLLLLLLPPQPPPQNTPKLLPLLNNAQRAMCQAQCQTNELTFFFFLQAICASAPVIPPQQ